MSALVFHPSKKAMKETLIGKHFSAMRYRETSMFGIEVKEGCKVVLAHRPLITGHLPTVNKNGKAGKSREFFVAVTIDSNGIITKVE